MSRSLIIRDATLARQLKADMRARGIARRMTALLRRLWPTVLQHIPLTPFAAWQPQKLRDALAWLRRTLQNHLHRELSAIGLWAGRGAAKSLKASLERNDIPLAAAPPMKPPPAKPPIGGFAPEPQGVFGVGGIIEPPSAFEIARIVGPAPLNLTKLFDVDRVTGAVWSGIADGMDRREIGKKLAVMLNNDMVAVRRVARTEGLRVATQIHLSVSEQIADEVEGYQIHAVLDAGTRPEHRARNGTIYWRHPKGDQKGFDQMPQPPIDPGGKLAWNCRCLTGSTVVHGQIKSISRAWYEGQGVEILTRGGARLTVTANHPVATKQGFVAANSIREGDHVISDGIRAGEFPDDVNDGKPTIEEVFKSALVGQSGGYFKRPDSLEFHGDGASMQGEVCVIFPNGELMDSCYPNPREFDNQRSFVGGTLGTVSGEHLTGSLFIGHGLPLQQFSVGPTTDCYAGLGEYANEAERALFLPPMYAAAGNSELVGERFHGFTSNVTLDETGRGFDSSLLPRKQSRFVFAPYRDPVFDEVTANDRIASAKFVGELLERHTGEIGLDEVVSVKHFAMATHVYSVDSGIGYYTASENRIAVVQGNCFLSPVFSGVGVPAPLPMPDRILTAHAFAPR